MEDCECTAVILVQYLRMLLMLIAFSAIVSSEMHRVEQSAILDMAWSVPISPCIAACLQITDYLDTGLMNQARTL